MKSQLGCLREAPRLASLLSINQHRVGTETRVQNFLAQSRASGPVALDRSVLVTVLAQVSSIQGGPPAAECLPFSYCGHTVCSVFILAACLSCFFFINLPMPGLCP